MATKTFKVSLSLDNPRIIQTGIKVRSFDKQSIKISIELTKNSQAYQIPTGAQIKISLLKLARQEQKIILDVPFTSADSIDWVVPDYLDGYQGEVRVGVYLIVGAENIDVGYFNITSSVSDIDSAAEEFTESVLQGWAIEDLTALLPQFQAVLDETTGKDVISAPEIILARNGEADLKTRLDKDQQQVTAQLAQKTSKGNVSVADINKNLGKFDQTFMTDEFLQQMAGNTPINTVPADKSITQIKVADKAINTTKTDFFGMGKNLFNKFSVESGKRVNVSTGELFNIAGVSTSDFIDVSPSASYHRNFTEAYAIYNGAGAIISGGDSASTNKVINIPGNGAKIKLTVKNENLDTFQFELGTVGTAYEVYKGVLSSQVKVQSESLPHIPLSKVSFTEIVAGGKNLYNHTDRLIGKQLNGDGSTPVNNGAYDTSDYISGSPGESITMSRASGSYMIVRAYEFYNKDKVFISGASQSTPYLPSTLTYPANAIYSRVSYFADSVNYQIEKGTVATSYEPYVPKLIIDGNVLPDKTPMDDSPFSNKTLVTNGDSITYGTTGTLPFTGGNYNNQVPWPQFVAEALKMGLSNHAIGGSTIAVKELSPTERDPIVIRYQSMADGDIIIIAGGSNDWQYTWTPLGDMTSRSSFTFYGALHNLCLGLLEKYKGKQIIFTTPIKRGQLAQEAVNGNGKTLKQYGDIIKEVCGYYGIPVIDMYNECTINPHIDTQRSEFIPDTVHPNRTGHELMAKRIGGYLRQLA